MSGGVRRCPAVSGGVRRCSELRDGPLSFPAPAPELRRDLAPSRAGPSRGDRGTVQREPAVIHHTWPWTAERHREVQSRAGSDRASRCWILHDSDLTLQGRAWQSQTGQDRVKQGGTRQSWISTTYQKSTVVERVAHSLHPVGIRFDIHARWSIETRLLHFRKTRSRSDQPGRRGGRYHSRTLRTCSLAAAAAFQCVLFAAAAPRAGEREESAESRRALAWSRAP